jgi:hypothetical protein
VTVAAADGLIGGAGGLIGGDTAAAADPGAGPTGRAVTRAPTVTGAGFAGVTEDDDTSVTAGAASGTGRRSANLAGSETRPPAGKAAGVELASSGPTDPIESAATGAARKALAVLRTA